MGAVKLQVTIEDNDIPYVERFLKGIAHDFSFSKDDDNFSEEELKRIELSHKQAKEGKLLKSEDVFKKLRTKYGNKMDY